MPSWWCLSIRLSACLSVRLSVTFMYSVKTSNHIFKFCALSGNHSILVFPYQTSWQYTRTDGNPAQMGGGRVQVGKQKSRLSTNIWLFHRWLVKCHCHQQFRPSARRVKCITADAHDDRHTSVSLVCDSKARRRFQHSSDRPTPKRIEHHLIVRSDKYEAEASNNRRLHPCYCTVEANY